MSSNRVNIFILILVPYIYLFPHTFQIIEMGNDFELLYYSYKKYIFEFLRVGHLPLWSPSESLGYSLIFNPFVYHGSIYHNSNYARISLDVRFQSLEKPLFQKYNDYFKTAEL